MATTVGPASNVYCNTDGRWMARGILNVNTHYGILSAHTLRSKADRIDTVLKQLLHFCLHLRCHCGEPIGRISALNLIARFRWMFLTNANKKRRTRIQSVGCHLIQYEIGDSFISCTWHQNHRFFQEAYIRRLPCMRRFRIYHCSEQYPTIRSGVPFPTFFLGIVLIKSLYRVVAERCRKGSLYNSLFQQAFQFIDVRKIRSAFQPELKHAGILAARTV